MDLLPMQLGATTALITTIQKGEDGIIAEFKGGSTQKFPLAKSSIESITETENAESIKILSQEFPYHGIRLWTPLVLTILQRAERKEPSTMSHLVML